MDAAVSVTEMLSITKKTKKNNIYFMQSNPSKKKLHCTHGRHINRRVSRK